MEPHSENFTLGDVSRRYFLTVLLHYWALLTEPIAYISYNVRHNLLWYGYIGGLALSFTIPVLPLGIAAVVLFKSVQSYFYPDWSMAGPGRVFFLKPDNFLAAFIWDCYLKQSMHIGQFYLVGTNSEGISHTWKDTLLTKDYWRAALDKVDGRLPRELGRWNGEELTMNYDLGTCDIVVKIPDSFLGIGDAFWNHGDDFKDAADLKAKLQAGYKGTEAMVLEKVRPKKELGVHSLDIVTLRTPDDDVKVISCLVWTDCLTDTSHSCRAGYCIDVETEVLTSPAAWYSPFFSKQKAPLIGTKMEGVREACKTAVAAHKACEEKWLTAVGWDAMIMPKDEVVFFEGNFAGARVPRRIFYSARTLVEFVISFAWPFGEGGSMRPGVQAFESFK